MPSVQESETGSGFINGKDAAPMRTTLAKMGHKQIQFDTNCAVGFLTDTVVQRRSKAMDMRFYWIRDRTRQGQFRVHWKRGKPNLEDYPTKYHPTNHHIARPTYVLNHVKMHLQKPLQAKSQQQNFKGVIKPITPNDQSNPLTDHHDLYLSRKHSRGNDSNSTSPAANHSV